MPFPYESPRRCYILTDETIDALARTFSSDDARMILAADSPEMCDLLQVDPPSALHLAAASRRLRMSAAQFDDAR